jgi:hypothetical protein
LWYESYDTRCLLHPPASLAINCWHCHTLLTWVFQVFLLGMWSPPMPYHPSCNFQEPVDFKPEKTQPNYSLAIQVTHLTIADIRDCKRYQFVLNSYYAAQDWSQEPI